MKKWGIIVQKMLGKLRYVTIFCLSFLLLAASLSMVGKPVNAVGYNDRPSTDNSLGLQVKSAMLIEFETGQVLYEVNADESLPMASMTKLMTEYLVLKEIANGRLTWDQVITVSSEAADTDPSESQIYLATGDKHTVRDLYIAMAVGSANDATKALAIATEGSLQAFIDKMNVTAEQLGLETAIFTSTTGLEDTTKMSARDVVKLARTMLMEHPELLEYSGLTSYQFRERDKNPMINFNYMLGANAGIESFKTVTYEGVDGLKTGFTSAAGYNFTGTVMRDGVRYISVVFDTRSMLSRFHETAKLYDYAFATFEKEMVLQPKSVVPEYESVKVKKGIQRQVPIVTSNDITLVKTKGTTPELQLLNAQLFSEDELVAPLEAGTKVGTLTYGYEDANGELLKYDVDLITTEEVEKASWFKLFFRGIGDFFSNLFDSILNLF